MNELQDISPLGLKKMMEEHERCLDPVYFFQQYISGKPITPETRDLIREWQKRDRILIDLKKRGRV